MSNIKEQIRAKIERKIKMMERNIASLGDGGASISIATYQDVLNIIDSMADEPPNKDLETEIATWIPAHLKGNVDEDIIDAVKRWGENVARHFYELGQASVRMPEEPSKDYDEAYMQSKIDKVGDRWKGVDVDKYMDEVRGREPSKDLEQAAEKLIDEALYKWSYDDEDGIEQYVHDAFVAGAQWQKERFEKNRLSNCDTLTKEEYDRETAFAVEIIEKEHRQPTFTDAINYGMRLQKEQMMKEAVELGTVDIYWEQDGDRAFPTFDPPAENLLLPDIISQRFKDGEKVKVIIVKEDEK